MAIRGKVDPEISTLLPSYSCYIIWLDNIYIYIRVILSGCPIDYPIYPYQASIGRPLEVLGMSIMGSAMANSGPQDDMTRGLKNRTRCFILADVCQTLHESLPKLPTAQD